MVFILIRKLEKYCTHFFKSPIISKEKTERETIKVKLSSIGEQNYYFKFVVGPY